METIGNKIKYYCLKHKEKDPIRIFNDICKQDFIRMHGPEHHILDGACILTAFKNAGGNIDLEKGLDWIINQGMKMPGAACGYWGVCGSTTSIGAALAFIDGTGPLSNDGSWGNHMLFTSNAILKMGKINGPRCCKRDAYISFEEAVDYINANYDVQLEKSMIRCTFSNRNQQCIQNRCPYHMD